MTALLYGHRLKEENWEYIQKLLEALHRADIKIAVDQDTKAQFSLHGFIVPGHIQISDQQADSDELDCVITLGGDGTILRALTKIKDKEIPILGINLGRLGFLASTEKTMIDDAITKLKAKKYKIKTRRLIQLSCDEPIFSDFPFALNDLTISKRDTASMITIHTYIDGELLNSYWADGLILATPTGSTGYSLSCGGPIVFPNSGNYVITPIAPHNLNVRPVVVPDSADLSFKIEGRSDNYLCTLDARQETITQEHIISVKRAPFEVKLIELEGKSFLSTIQEKLMWGLDKRN